MTYGCNNWRGHRWSQWGAPVAREHFEKPGYVEFTQKRTCERCAMVQFYSVPRLSEIG